MANWAAMLPIDTVKSKYQVSPQGKYSGVIQVAKEIMKVDGVKGFYKVLCHSDFWFISSSSENSSDPM